MRKLSLFLLPAFILLSSCSTTQSAAGDDPAYFEALSEEQAQDELAGVLKEIDELDEEIRGAEARRDSARVRQASGGITSDAVEGTEAELEALRARKGGLINRQVQLEKRLRQFQGDKY